MAKSRSRRVIESTPCPLCGAAPGERCKNPIPESESKYGRVDPADDAPGRRALNPAYADRRAQPAREHLERRAAWQSRRDVQEEGR